MHVRVLGQYRGIRDKLKAEKGWVLVPTLPRGNAVCDAPRRLGSHHGGETAGTRSVPDGGSHAGAWEPVDRKSGPYSSLALIPRYWVLGASIIARG